MTAAEITLNSIVQANSGLMVSEVGGELVMMDIEKGTYYGLDPVAARIWRAVAEPTRLSDLCMSLMDQYEVAQDMCEVEVLAFVRELRDAGLVSAI